MRNPNNLNQVKIELDPELQPSTFPLPGATSWTSRNPKEHNLKITALEKNIEDGKSILKIRILLHDPREHDSLGS